jgi:VWFA-related protein
MPFSLRRRALVPALAILVLSAAGQPAAQQTPRTIAGAGGAEVVTFDFVALGRDGQPILDLKPEDVTLKVDGKTRTLKSLRLITPGAEPATPGGGEPAPAPFGSNTPRDAGRSIVIVIDDESIRAGNEPPMKAAIGQFLQSLNGRDQAALVTVPHGGVKVNFTSDFDSIRQFVLSITGQAPQSETADEASCRTRNTLQALAGTIEVMGGAVGPTTFAFFTSSMMGSRSAISISSRTGGGGGVNNVGMCEILPEEFQRVGAVTAAARANLYIIQHDPVVASAIPTPSPGNVRGSDSPRAGVENLAGVTGGTMLALAGGSETALTRILRETSAYYIADFDAEPQERNGGSHQTSVKVNRDGAIVRSRPDMIIPRTDSAARATAANPQAMILDARTFTELPMRVGGYVAREEANGQLKIVAVGEPVDPGAQITGASAGLFDQAGRLSAQWSANPAELAVLADRKMIVAALPAPPGIYRLRMALTDAVGRRGTADVEVTSELAIAGPLKLSNIVLGLSRENDFRPKLEFTTEPVALASFEIYGGQAGTAVRVLIEVAPSLNGPALFTMPAAISANRREDDRFAVTAAIPIGNLPAGDYVVRAIVNADGQTEGRVVRTLRKAR